MKWVKIGLAVVIVAFLIAAPHVLSSFYLRVVTEILIYGALAMAVNILSGYTGLAPFGQAGIFGVAAYAVGYLIVKVPEPQPIWITAPAGIMMSVIVSVIFGAVAIRTTDIYFLLITLAEGMIVWGLAYRWASITGAENGLRGIDRPAIVADFQTYYYVVLVVMALVAYGIYRVVNSPFGLTLKGIREGERRMQALGYNVPLHKFVAFVIAGFFSGVIGVVYVYYNEFVSPATVDFARSAEELIMVILGGSGTFWGPLVGATIITSVKHQVSLYTDRWLMILGGIYVLTILVAPHGLLRGAGHLWERVTGRGVEEKGGLLKEREGAVAETGEEVVRVR